MQKQNPYRIVTNRLVIRRYRPEDAEMVSRAIAVSLENLKKWMPWARSEPSDLESKKALLKKFEQDFIKNIDYTFGLFNKREDVLIGSSGLHTRIGAKSREIGYWINSNFLNQGYATESSRALTKVGFEYHGVDAIEIHCDPKNIKSLKIPRKLGFELIEIKKENTRDPSASTRDTMIWKMTRDNYHNMLDHFPEVEVFFE